MSPEDVGVNAGSTPLYPSGRGRKWAGRMVELIGLAVAFAIVFLIASAIYESHRGPSAAPLLVAVAVIAVFLVMKFHKLGLILVIGALAIFFLRACA